MIFELAVLALVGVFLLLIYKINQNIWRRFSLACIAVLLFQYFTQAMWLNKNLEPWAYIYLDVSWILTVGWAGIIVVSMQLIESYFPDLTEGAKYIYSIVLIGFVGFLAEWVVVGLGIRFYPQAVIEVLSGIKVAYGKVPIEALYYIPVFMALMVAFVRYWEMLIDSYQKTKKRSKR